MSDTKTVTTKSTKPSILRTDAIAVLENVAAANPGKLTYEDKSGWTKVTNESSKGRVYIQLRDDVREVHLSGWGKGFEGTVEPPKANGKVEAWLDLSSPDAINNLETILNALARQEAPAPAPKKERAVSQKPAKAKSVTNDEDRVAAIRARAAELGIGEKLETDVDGEAVDPVAFEAAVDAAISADA